jgi:hypothetical protein
MSFANADGAKRKSGNCIPHKNAPHCGMSDLQSTQRAPRNFDEVQGVLIAMAKKIGSIYGVAISVGKRGDELIFVSDDGLEIIDPGGLNNSASTILCASGREIDSGDFLKLFAARSLYAALAVRFNAIDAGLAP